MIYTVKRMPVVNIVSNMMNLVTNRISINKEVFRTVNLIKKLIKQTNQNLCFKPVKDKPKLSF